MLTELATLPLLSSNGQFLSNSPDRLGWLEPSDPRQPLDRLQEQYEAQGYLWLKRILDPAAVLAFRRSYFQAFQTSGLLAPGTDPVEGQYGEGGEDPELVHRLSVEAVRQAEYDAFCRSEPIQRFYETFLGGPVYLHKRKLMRYTRPGDPHATGAHYDLTYLRDGTDRLCTSWIPLGPVPVAMGGLVYLENSHHLGRQLEQTLKQNSTNLFGEDTLREGDTSNTLKRSNGWLSTDLAGLAEQTDRRWLIADYEAGDMVVHSPYTIHASTDNADPLGRLRLSTDIRYQRQSDPIDPRWTNDWSPDDNL